MRAQQDQERSLFDGTNIPEGYRGRVSQPAAFNLSTRWIIATFCAVLFGLTTVATAITMKHNAHEAQTTYTGHNLSTNFSLRQWGSGFEEAVY